MDNIVIRPGRLEDEKDIQEFTRHTFDWGDYVADAYRSWVREMARGEGEVYVAVHTPTGKAVGVDHARYISPDEAWLEGIRVHSDHRREGIGRLLATAAIDGARRRGIRVCRAAIDGDNLPSQSLSRSFGFEPVAPIIQFEAPLGVLTLEGVQAPGPSGAPETGGLRLRDATVSDAAAVFAAVSKEMSYVGSDYTWWRVTPENVERAIAQRAFRLAVDPHDRVVAGAALSDTFVDTESDRPVLYGEMSSPFGDCKGLMAVVREYTAAVTREASKKGMSGKLCITCEARSPVAEALPRHRFTERYLEGRRDEIWLWELLLAD